MLSLCASRAFAMERLRGLAPKQRGQKPERPAVSDIVYLAAGAGVFALMALYAYACDRL
jgi:hypothetical protein